VVHEPGAGVEGRLGGTRYRVGRRDYVAAIAPAAPGGDAAVYLARDGEWLARFDLEDPLRPDAAHVVSQLAELGLPVEIASGDHLDAVREAALAAGVTRYHARMRPEDKVALVRQEEQAGTRVVMVGDGINDAPVLAAASVSIAMGAGATLAQTSADAVLMVAELDPLPAAIVTARRTVAVIRENLAWAVAYNVLALPLAALGFVPPWAAAIGMSASSLLVVANALRLRRDGRQGRRLVGALPQAGITT
jgi:Cu2+-exporting ATPase